MCVFTKKHSLDDIHYGEGTPPPPANTPLFYNKEGVGGSVGDRDNEGTKSSKKKNDKYSSISEKEKEGEGEYTTVDIELSSFKPSEHFSIPPSTLISLFDPRNEDLLQKLGDIDTISKSLYTDLLNGISSDNLLADERVSVYGRNITPPAPFKTVLQIILTTLEDAVLRILIVAAVISIVLGALPWTSEDPRYGWIDGVAILVAVIIILLVTTVNDVQKQKQFRQLEDKKKDRDVEVVRDGVHTKISVFDLLVGDILVLSSGDILCADGLFIDGHSMRCDESSVSGESDSIRKGLLNNRLDPFFISGSVVMEGNGTMLVTCVGERSFQGKTMMSLTVEEEKTPLQDQLEVLATRIGYCGLVAAVIMLLIVIPKYFITKSLAHEKFGGDTTSDVFRYVIEAISIVVVAIPEGLPLAVTMALAYGVLKLFKENNLVRYLSACETMAHATNICSDKTGTLTQNLMTVVTGHVMGVGFSEDDDSASVLKGQLSPDLLNFLTTSIACNSTSNEIVNEKGIKDFTGSKTEGALLRFVSQFLQTVGASAAAAPPTIKSVRESYEVVQLYPFSSARKCMNVLVKDTVSHNKLYTKGASEIVLGMCSNMLNREGKVERLTDIKRQELESVITAMAQQALRTLCVAYADVPVSKNVEEPPNKELTLLAIVGIRDPIRPEVSGAVVACQRMGITVRMVTGDNIVTAENIARNCGILTAEGTCIDGPTFRTMPKEKVLEILPNLQVLARSSPLDKKMLVEYLKDQGEVVAVTGDGTNDAPALKTAHIGFSMGISGTEVAIAASSIVLLDDNFASIIKAILWGRNIFDAIRKFIQFQITVNIVAVTVAFVGSVSSTRSPLTALQLLWVNLIMDTLAALALATEPPSEEVLSRGPVSKNDPLISRKMWRNIFIQSIYQLIACFVLLYRGDEIFHVVKYSTVHYTIIFNSFVWMQLFNEINARKLADELNSFKGILQNPMFLGVFVATSIVQVLFVEVGNPRFTATEHLDYYQWGACIVIGLISLPLGVLMRFVPLPRYIPFLAAESSETPSRKPVSRLTAYEQLDE